MSMNLARYFLSNTSYGSGLLCSMSWPVSIRKYQRSFQCIPSHVFLHRRLSTAPATPSCLFAYTLLEQAFNIHGLRDWLISLRHCLHFVLTDGFLILPLLHWFAVPDIGPRLPSPLFPPFQWHSRGLVSGTSLLSMQLFLVLVCHSLLPSFSLFVCCCFLRKVISSPQHRKLVGVF